jgi:branched-chain amino acid transport system substrate-binding protein
MKTGPLLGRVLAMVPLALEALGSAPAHAAEPYQINVVMPLTGSGAFLGQGEKKALELAEKSVNDAGGIKGQPLQFIFHDDQSNPQVGVQLASGIVAQKPAVILGSSLVAVCRAIAPLMKNGGPVQYCFSPGLHPPPGSYSFTASVSTYDLADLAIRFFRQKGWTRLAFLFSADATGQDAENGFNKILAMPENKDMKVVANAHFNITDVSVAAQIESIKAAHPQAFVAWSTGTPIATVFHGMIQANFNVPMATTDGNMTYQQMKNYASFLPDQLYIPAGQYVIRDPSLVPPAIAKEQAEFYRVFDGAGIKPDEPSELAWQPAMIIIHALQTLGPSASAEQIRDFIANLENYPSIDGMLNFKQVPQRGLAVDNAVMTLWDKQKQVWQVVSKPGGAPLP